jgi:hypothetical protein
MARTVPCVAEAGNEAMRLASSWAREQLVAQHDLGDETEPQRGLRRDPFAVAGQGHPQRVAETDSRIRPIG